MPRSHQCQPDGREQLRGERGSSKKHLICDRSFLVSSEVPTEQVRCSRADLGTLEEQCTEASCGSKAESSVPKGTPGSKCKCKCLQEGTQQGVWHPPDIGRASLRKEACGETQGRPAGDPQSPCEMKYFKQQKEKKWVGGLAQTCSMYQSQHVWRSEDNFWE